MTNDNPNSNEEAERSGEEIHDRTLADSARILANGTAVPFQFQKQDNLRAGFILGATELGALMNRATLKRVAGTTLENVPATVEIMRDRIRISTSSPDSAAGSTYKTGTYVSDANLGAVTFGIDLVTMMKIAEAFRGEDLAFTLHSDGGGGVLKLNEFRRGRQASSLFQVSVQAGEIPTLLQGERVHRSKIASPRALAKALRLCTAARPTTPSGKCVIEIGDGLATAQSTRIVILVRDPSLCAIGTQIPLVEARKMALAFAYMADADVFETESSIIVADNAVEVAIKKTDRPRFLLKDAVAALVGQDVVQGRVQGLFQASYVNAMAKQYSRVASRKGEPSPPIQLAQARIEDGKVKFHLARRRIIAQTTVEDCLAKNPCPDRDWGAFDLSSVMQVWDEIQARGDPDKQMRLATCGTAMKLESPSDLLEAYFMYNVPEDPRFRNT